MSNYGQGRLAALMPSPGFAADAAAADTNMAFNASQGILDRNLSRMGVNPGSPRYAGLQQKWAMQRAASVSGNKTRAANAARDQSFSRLMQLIQLGRSGAFSPQRAMQVGGLPGGTVGPRQGGGGSGYTEIGEQKAGIRRVGEGKLEAPLPDNYDALVQAAVARRRAASGGSVPTTMTRPPDFGESEGVPEPELSVGRRMALESPLLSYSRLRSNHE